MARRPAILSRTWQKRGKCIGHGRTPNLNR
jgi:hypothetical protein